MDDFELKDIGEFIGTLQYTNVMGAKVTDGVVYVMRNGYSWLVTDMIAILRMKLQNEEFCAVKLKLDGTKAKAIITDGNNKVLYSQDYSYTDAKKEFMMFYTNGVLMLSGEY